MNPISIRPIKAGDAESLAALSEEFAQNLNILRKGPGKTAMTRDVFVKDGFGGRPAFSGLLATMRDQPVAYLLYHPGYMIDYAARTVQVIDLFVSQMARASGVATALMSALIPIARGESATIICSSVSSLTPEMKGFYKQIGVQFMKDKTTLIWHKDSWPG